MSRARHSLAIALLFIGVTGGAVLFSFAFKNSPVTPERATVLPETRQLPTFSLLDTRGQAFDRDDLLGQWQLLFFGFTNCPDICPATLQQLALARDRALRNGQPYPQIVLVSVDPQRDTPSIMADYVGHFGDDVVGLTGSPDAISQLTRPLGIYSAIVGDPDGDYTVDHSSVVLLIDDMANWRAVFGAPHDVESFASDIQLLMDAG